MECQRSVHLDEHSQPTIDVSSDDEERGMAQQLTQPLDEPAHSSTKNIKNDGETEDLNLVPPSPFDKNAIIAFHCGHMYHKVSVKKWFSETGFTTPRKCIPCRKEVAQNTQQLVPSVASHPEQLPRRNESEADATTSNLPVSLDYSNSPPINVTGPGSSVSSSTAASTAARTRSAVGVLVGGGIYNYVEAPSTFPNYCGPIRYGNYELATAGTYDSASVPGNCPKRVHLYFMEVVPGVEVTISNTPTVANSSVSIRNNEPTVAPIYAIRTAPAPATTTSSSQISTVGAVNHQMLLDNEIICETDKLTYREFKDATGDVSD